MKKLKIKGQRGKGKDFIFLYKISKKIPDIMDYLNFKLNTPEKFYIMK